MVRPRGCGREIRPRRTEGVEQECVLRVLLLGQLVEAVGEELHRFEIDAPAGRSHQSSGLVDAGRRQRSGQVAGDFPDRDPVVLRWVPGYGKLTRSIECDPTLARGQD